MTKGDNIPNWLKVQRESLIRVQEKKAADYAERKRLEAEEEKDDTQFWDITKAIQPIEADFNETSNTLALHSIKPEDISREDYIMGPLSAKNNQETYRLIVNTVNTPYAQVRYEAFLRQTKNANKITYDGKPIKLESVILGNPLDRNVL